MGFYTVVVMVLIGIRFVDVKLGNPRMIAVARCFLQADSAQIQ